MDAERRAALERAVRACLALAQLAEGPLNSHRRQEATVSTTERWWPDDAGLAALWRDPFSWMEAERATLATPVHGQISSGAPTEVSASVDDRAVDPGRPPTGLAALAVGWAGGWLG